MSELQHNPRIVVLHSLLDNPPCFIVPTTHYSLDQMALSSKASGQNGIGTSWTVSELYFQLRPHFCIGRLRAILSRPVPLLPPLSTTGIRRLTLKHSKSWMTEDVNRIRNPLAIDCHDRDFVGLFDGFRLSSSSSIVEISPSRGRGVIVLNVLDHNHRS